MKKSMKVLAFIMALCMIAAVTVYAEGVPDQAPADAGSAQAPGGESPGGPGGPGAGCAGARRPVDPRPCASGASARP